MCMGSKNQAERRKVMNERKTLDDLIRSDKDCFVAGDVCGVLEMDPHTIRLAARQRPELLGFRTIITGCRVKIPRIPFLQFMGVSESIIEKRGQA